VADFAEDLRCYLRGEPVEAQRRSRVAAAARWCKKRPVRATIASVLILALLVWGVAQQLAAIRLMREAAGVHVIRGDSCAVLVNARGATLYEWDTHAPQGVSLARFVGSAESSDGSPRLVLLFSGTDQQLDQHLLVFDPAQPHNPLWAVIDGEHPVVPPITLSQPNDSFRVTNAFLEDIFEDLPGPEIVVLILHKPNYPSCVRIYNLAGDVLFEAWHSGHILEAAWSRSAGQLLVHAAENAIVWEHLVIDPPRTRLYAQALFALKPMRGVGLDAPTAHISAAPTGVVSENPPTVWLLDMFGRDSAGHEEHWVRGLDAHGAPCRRVGGSTKEPPVRPSPWPIER
jgi:hypothetical protein